MTGDSPVSVSSTEPDEQRDPGGVDERWKPEDLYVRNLVSETERARRRHIEPERVDE